MKLRCTYLSDGTKVSALDAAGDGLLYRGSFVYEKDGSSVNLESVAWDEGRIGAQPFQDQWFVKDHLGNVRSIIDLTRSATMPADSVILEQNDYLPYGTKSSTSSLSTDSAFRYRYAGKEEQRFGTFDSQLLDFGARYYDPWSCQWTAVDPIAEKSYSQSSTNYCVNNPLNYCDPYGRDTVYVLDQASRPQDKGAVGTTYTAEIIVVKNGVVSGEYRGSSYPNSTSPTDNSTPFNTISEGRHSYSNKYGHTPTSTHITERGLNIDDSDNGSRTTFGLNPDGEPVVMDHVNVHAGKSDNGGYRSRGSKGCITIHPDDAPAFFENFNWAPQGNGVTGNSSGSIFVFRNMINPSYCFPK